MDFFKNKIAQRLGGVQFGVEVQSISKAFDMTGWRLGFLAGNKKLVKAYGTVFQCAQEVAEFLIMNANIPVVPWDDCGSYLRFSVTYEAGSAEEEIRVMNEFKERLGALNLIF
ncbi:MAG: aminotransferase class I/II-fold pyridoxal phosphate-dependent enzyme [Clostridiales bacterium]|nr:aminotransferase class I/II-fold pyridoxal phosphate-dependent enzyme [Clostridiales bacterium]